MKTACNDCPFRSDIPLEGSPDWLHDIFAFHRLGKSFKHTCHKTDPNADGYIAGTARGCHGIQKLGQPGFYKSIPDLLLAYVLNWEKTGLIPKDLSK